jgi:hypothetical protein
MKQLGWSCYRVAHSHLIPNDTGERVNGPILSCDAYPSLGGYPLSKRYGADFLIEGGKVSILQVTISDPGI